MKDLELSYLCGEMLLVTGNSPIVVRRCDIVHAGLPWLPTVLASSAAAESSALTYDARGSHKPDDP